MVKKKCPWEIQIFIFLVYDLFSRFFKRYIYTRSYRIDFCSCFITRVRWSSSKTLYDIEQWRIRSIALILPLSVDDGCGAKALDLWCAWIGSPEQRKCFVAQLFHFSIGAMRIFFFPFMRKRENSMWKIKQTYHMYFASRTKFYSFWYIL